MNKQSIDVLNISQNVINMLKENNITTVDKLCKQSKSDLRKMKILKYDIDKIDIELQLLGLNLKNSL